MSKKTLFNFGVVFFLVTLNAISFAGDGEFPRKDFAHGKRSCSVVRNPKESEKRGPISFQQSFFKNPDNARHRAPGPFADILGRSAFSSSSGVSDSKSQLSKHDVKQIILGEDVRPQTKKKSQRHTLRKKRELQKANHHPSHNHFLGTVKQPHSSSKQHERRKHVAPVSASSHDNLHNQNEQPEKILSPKTQEKQLRAAYLKSIRYNGKYPRHLGGKTGPSRQQRHDAKIKRIENTFYSDQVQH